MSVNNETPDLLVCTRLADMTNMHPEQDDTHKCDKCGHPVGIYPSGQRALTRWPAMKIRCIVCAMANRPAIVTDIPAPQSLDELMQEIRESKPVIRQ